MASQERIQQLVTEKFNTAIYGIRDAGVPGISDMAARAVDKIRVPELAVAFKSPDLISYSVTGFDLWTVQPVPRLLLAPAIVLDPGKVMEFSSEKVQADLVRTLAIADTYPDNGFANRLHDVYGNALDVQKKWLQTQDVAKIPFDPRETDKEELIKSLMGDRRYYTDFGIADWHAAMDRLAADPSVQKHGPRLRNNANHAMTMRQEYAKFVYYEGLKRGIDFSKKTADDRAELLATAMLGLTLASPSFQS